MKPEVFRFIIRRCLALVALILMLLLCSLLYVSEHGIKSIFNNTHTIQEKVEAPQQKPGPGTAPPTLSAEIFPVGVDDWEDKGNIKQWVFGVPRPQYIFDVHYHKTGDLITYMYFDAVEKAAKELNVSSVNVIPHRVFVKFYHQELTYNFKRTNQYLKDLNKPLINFIHMIRPNLLCYLYQHDCFVPTDELPGDIKFIHMIRDPFDMAISNYLYHSQQPSPEKWVHKFNPCSVDHNRLRVYYHNQTTTIITQHQVEALSVLCHKLMLNNSTNRPYQGFYPALLGLPTYDGLRLSMIVQLISKGRGDILRMTNNVEQLHEWNQRQRQAGGSSRDNALQNRVISLMTYPDWDSKNYNTSLDFLTEFILADLEVMGDNGDENDNLAGERAKQRYKDDFVKAVRINALENLSKTRKQNNGNHVTKNIMTPEDREAMVAKLQSDELFGPILSACQKIISIADGPKKLPKEESS